MKVTQSSTVRAETLVNGYFGEGLSLSETARKYDVKRSRVEGEFKKRGLKLRSMGEGVRLSKLGRPRVRLSLKPGPRAVAADKWKIVELKAAGKSNLEIAKELNRAQVSIYLALRKMGFPPGAPCYSFGEIFDRPALRHLHDLSGLLVKELAKELGMPFATIEAALSERYPARQIHFNTAQRASQWRTGLFRQLLSNAVRRPHRQDQYSQATILLTFFPRLRERYLLFQQVLDELAKKLRENPEWSLSQLQQFLIAQAVGEKAGRIQGDLFTRFLPLAPHLTPFLGKRLADLRGVHHQRIALESMASALGTTASTVSRLANPTQARALRSIVPRDMREVILKWHGDERKRKLSDDTELRIELAACLRIEGLKNLAMKHQLFPRQSISSNAKDSTKKFFLRHESHVRAAQERMTVMSHGERIRIAKSARARLANS